MKRIICLCAVLFLLGGCAKSAGSVTPDISVRETPPESKSAVSDTPNPIPVLKGISFGNVDAVELWRDTASENRMYPLNDEEQEEAVFNRLKQIQLHEKDENIKVKLAPTLKYDVRLKCGEVIHIGFAGLYVEFGDGAYTYENCDKAVFPQTVRAVSVESENSSFSYQNEADITALLDMLTPNPCTEHVDFSEADAHIPFYVISQGNYSAESYKAQNNGASICIFKEFFTLNTCLGTIGGDAYGQLEIAQNGQFGTLLHLAITSGGATIYPTSYFVSSMTYDEDAGGLLCADGFPRIEDYIDTLETLTLAEDFSIWIKASNNTSFKIVCDVDIIKEGGALTYSELERLEAGTYQAEIYVTKTGDYVEKLDAYESFCDVYYFQVHVE